MNGKTKGEKTKEIKLYVEQWTGETRRDKIRQVMNKLAKDGKIRISEATDRKGKMYLYELAEK